MDLSFYKTITTQRGLQYNYASFPVDGTPRDTLLFIHGFPSTSFDWRNQVEFFRKEGFALIIPDMLGAGETAKPTDVELFKFSAMAADIIDILDVEKTGKVIVITHDWGSGLTSRLASYYPDRFKAYAFLAAGYSPSNTDFDYEAAMAFIKELVGYEPYGYWQFFCEDGMDKVIENHLDSFLSILYPSDPALWKTSMAPRGAMKAWITGDKRAPLPSYFTTEDVKYISELIKRDGIGSSLNWYKVYMSGIAADDDKGIPPANMTIAQPVLYCACEKDYISLSALSTPIMQKYCTDLTIKTFDAGHWVQLEAPDRLNAAILEWINAFTGKV